MLVLLTTAALVFVSAPDGDTLTVRDGSVKTIVRLAEIDAPERKFSKCGRVENVR